MAEGTVWGAQIVARIDPARREEIEHAIEELLCPGHHTERGARAICSLTMFATTSHDDVDTVIRWVSP